jgi:hypothetical protein
MYKNIPENNQKFFEQRVNAVMTNTAKKHPVYQYPKDKEEYWNIVNEYWNELTNIMLRFLPKFLPKQTDIITFLNELKDNKNPELARMFNLTWIGAPDSGEIHAIPAWNVLCDLCSECYLLEESE